MYLYKTYEPDVSKMSTREGIAFNQMRLKVFKAYAEGCLMLDLTDGKRPSVEIVEETSSDFNITAKSAVKMNGSYHPLKNRICISKDAPDPAATTLHELYHCYVKQNGLQLSHYEEEDACEEFAARAMGEIFEEKYDPVDQRDEEEEEEINEGWIYYRSGAFMLPAYQKGNNLFVYDNLGHLLFQKRLQFDPWEGRVVAV